MSLFGHDVFYWGLIKKYVIVMGTIFKDMRITRTDAEGDVFQIMPVPISFAPKDKMLARMTADPNLENEAAIVLPRMAFDLISFNYAPGRKLNTLGRIVKKNNDDANKLYYQYNPVPYDFHFALYVMAKNAEDAAKIVEQIAPFFTPDWTVSTTLLDDDLNNVVDIPVVLEGTSIEDVYEGDFSTRRALIYILNFKLQGFLWGPKRNKPIIKIATQNYYFGNTADPSDIIGRLTTTPGLLANGSPTTNAAASVNTNIIEVDDDFGFATVFEDGSALFED